MTNSCCRWFQLERHGTTPRTELLGGITTFATMAYIIVVNPAILEHAGIPRGPSTVATILAAVFGCLFMGLYANRPFAVAPYMGENAFIAFTLTHYLIDGQAITWQQRLGTVFVSGLAFFILTVLRLRTWLAEAISPSMKHSFAVGIGLFLLLIGMNLAGVVAINTPAAPLKVGDFADARVLLALGGFCLMALLLVWRVQGAILLGILAVGVLGWLLGYAEAPSRWVALPWEDEYHLGAVAGQLDIQGVLRLTFFPILLTLFLISFLDTLGTLLALGSAGRMLDEKGNLSEIHKPMIVDSVSCMFSALVGTSTSGAYIESATGMREGARTGLAAIVTGLLFAAALFFIPLLEPLQKLSFAYGPALMVVGLLMFAAVRNLDFDDLTELVPALASIAMMVFTYNIANGLTAGLMLHPGFKLASGRWKEIHPGGAVLAVLCAFYYAVGLPH